MYSDKDHRLMVETLVKLIVNQLVGIEGTIVTIREEVVQALGGLKQSATPGRGWGSSRDDVP